MDETEQVSTTVWLAANREPLEQVRDLKEQMLGMTALAEEIVASTTTPEIQEATRTYLGGQQLHVFPELVTAHRAVPYDELIERREQAETRLHSLVGQLAVTDSDTGEEADAIRRDTALVTERIPELGASLADIVAGAIARRQQEKRGRLDQEQQETAADLEQLNAAIADVGFIPLPILASSEQQREAYDTARGITAEKEATDLDLPEGGETKPEDWEHGYGWKAADYMVQHAGKMLTITEVAAAAYGLEDENAVRKLNALVYGAAGQRTPLSERLAEAGLTLRREKELLPLEGADRRRRRYRYFLGAFPAEPEPQE